MKLWSGLLSPFSAKVRIVLAEKGLECEIRNVPWNRKTLWGPKPPEFLAVSPRGQVPVLIDGDTVLHDSTVINEYLEDRYPQSPLFPREPAARARCRLLEDEADQAMTVEVTPLVQELFTQQDESKRNLTRVTEAQAALAQRFGRLERELAGGQYLCGEFSVADVATFLVLAFAATFGVAPGEDQPKLRAWFERVQARPTVNREFAAMMQGAAAV